MGGVSRPTALPAAPRILRLRGWALCLCATWCREPGGGSGGAAAFVVPPTTSGRVQLHSCGCGERERRKDGFPSKTTAAKRRPNPATSCSMTSTDVASTVRNRSRARLPTSKFEVYTGPRRTVEEGSKLAAARRAKRQREFALGEKIQNEVRLRKVKKELIGGVGEDVVTDEMWAGAAQEASVEALQKAIEDGESARQELVLLNLGVVNNIVMGYLRAMSGDGSTMEVTATDMMQEATMGLIRAVEKFDPTRGFRFSTYAQWWIRKYVNECLQNHNRIIRIPQNVAYLVSKVNRVKKELFKELGRAPTLAELSTASGCSAQQTQRSLEQSAFRVSSLDEVCGFGRRPGAAGGSYYDRVGDGHVNMVDMIGSGKSVSAEHFLQLELRADLSTTLFRLLDATERQCLVLRYGLEDGVPRSAVETARVMNYSHPESVHTITRNAMAKLRKGCLPRERNKLVTFLSRYEPDTLTGKNSADSRRWGDRNKDSRRGNGEGANVVADKEEEVVRGDTAEVEVQEVVEEVERDGGQQGVLDDDDPNKTWDFSSHGREELQYELARYLSERGLDRQSEEEVEKEDGGGDWRGPEERSTTLSASKAKGWSKGVLAKDRARSAEAESPVAAAAATTAASAPTVDVEVAASVSASTKARESLNKPLERGDGKTKGWGKGVLANTTKARKGSNSGPSAESASVDSVKRGREGRLRLEARERERELEEEEERLRSLPIPIGDGAGSAVIGGLEPLPNSREEDQLKQLSRLLWDGEEEPADFALSYGSRP